MPAVPRNMSVPVNGTWRKTIRLKQRKPTRQDPNHKEPMDLTGFHVKLEARHAPADLDPVFTISDQLSDSPNALVPPLGPSGVISWALNVAALDLTAGTTALFELLLIDPDGNPDPILDGMLTFEQGVTRV